MLAPRTVLVSCLALTALVAGAAPSSLLSKSPFAPPAPPQQQVQQQAGRFELRGVVSIGGEPRFSVLDTSNSKNYWLRLNEAEDGVRVTGYNPSVESVIVEAEGVAAQTAVLKEVQIVAMAVAAPMPAPMPNMQNPGVPPQAGGVAAPPSEQEIQERRQRIVEELRRRRALRQNPNAAPASP